jgi:Domain of unknown function (DUF4845)
MKKEKGLTLTGMVLASIAGGILLLLAFKIVPVYTEYFAIERNLKAMAIDPKVRNAGPKAVAGAWALRAAVDDLNSLDGEYIEMTKEGEAIVLTGEYSKKVPLVRNVSACFDFKPSSK